MNLDVWVSQNDFAYMVLCAIWYHVHNFKNVKNTHGGMLISVKLQAEACIFTKISTPWVFFTFFKLYKWYQIAQRITYVSLHMSFNMLVTIYERFN